MNQFSSAWLELREPYDQRARSDRLTRELDSRLNPNRRIRCIDLGSGTGANVRYLSKRIQTPQAWTCIEYDTTLTERLASNLRDTLHPPHQFDIQTLDVVNDWTALDLQCDVITASALLDLVSESWLRQLARTCGERKIAYGYFALSFNGELRWTPNHSLDSWIADQFRAHQRTDKGFGAAIGPDAAGVTAAAFERRGYSVLTASTPWCFGPEDRDIQSALLSGYVGAAIDMSPAKRAAIEQWAVDRSELIARGVSTHVVGHTDVFVVCR